MLLGVGVLCEHMFLQQNDECYLVWVCCVNMCFLQQNDECYLVWVCCVNMCF